MLDIDGALLATDQGRVHKNTNNTPPSSRPRGAGHGARGPTDLGIGKLNGKRPPPATDGPMGGWVGVFVMGAFAEMPGTWGTTAVSAT